MGGPARTRSFVHVHVGVPPSSERWDVLKHVTLVHVSAQTWTMRTLVIYTTVLCTAQTCCSIFCLDLDWGILCFRHPNSDTASFRWFSIPRTLDNYKTEQNMQNICFTVLLLFLYRTTDDCLSIWFRKWFCFSEKLGSGAFSIILNGGCDCYAEIIWGYTCSLTNNYALVFKALVICTLRRNPHHVTVLNSQCCSITPFYF